MVRVNLLCIILTIVTFSAHAEMGFLPINHMNVPDSVKQGSSSVYKIVTPDGSPRVFDISTDEKLTNAAKELGLEGWWIVSQLDYCKSKGRTSCLTFDKMAEGTAFVVEEESIIYTNLHNVRQHIQQFFSAIEPDKSKKLIAEYSIPVLLLDKDGNRVFPTDEIAGDAKIFSMVYKEETLLGSMRAANFLTNDFVKMKLNLNVGKPLTFSKVPLGTGDRVFAIGYPIPTTDRMSRFSAPDSDGESIRVTFGEVLDLKEARVLADDAPLSAADESLYQPRAFYSTADGISGMSGGPFFNSSGEVVGIFNAHVDTVENPSRRLGKGVKATFMSLVPSVLSE